MPASPASRPGLGSSQRRSAPAQARWHGATPLSSSSSCCAMYAVAVHAACSKEDALEPLALSAPIAEEVVLMQCHQSSQILLRNGFYTADTEDQPGGVEDYKGKHFKVSKVHFSAAAVLGRLGSRELFSVLGLLLLLSFRYDEGGTPLW